jgi:hypothetical protein
VEISETDFPEAARSGPMTAAMLYRFAEHVLLEEVEAALVVAAVAIESLHGGPAAQLAAAYFFDPLTRICVIDATTSIGFAFNQLFLGFLNRDVGAESFTVERHAELASRVVA